MGIPIGKLALYSATGGLHPSLTLPVSLDVGTDNRQLLGDPLYIGYRSRRLRGPAYDELVEAFVEGVAETWPGCVIQWEDFKGPNALRILDHFRDRVPSFNDDVQGTAAVALAGIYSAARLLGRGTCPSCASCWPVRVRPASASLACCTSPSSIQGCRRSRRVARSALLDSRGLVHGGRDDLDEFKRDVAVPVDAVARLGLTLEGDDHHRLSEVIRAVRPDVLIGTTGQPGSFDGEVIRRAVRGRRAAGRLRPLEPVHGSRPRPRTSSAWSEGRVIVATGSPFPARDLGGPGAARRPGQQRLHLPRRRPRRRRRRGAHHHRAHVPGGRPGRWPRRSATTASPRARLYPPIEALADISRQVALAVAGGGRARQASAGIGPGWTCRPSSTRRCGIPTTCPTSVRAPRSTATSSTPPTRPSGCRADGEVIIRYVASVSRRRRGRATSRPRRRPLSAHAR